MIRPAALAAALVAALQTPAAACRFNAGIADRIAGSGADTILLVVVQSAVAGAPTPDGTPWRGIAFLNAALKGTAAGSTYAIGRPGATAACDDGIPPPRLGDVWVLYLKRGERLTYGAAGIDYPLSVAIEADPGLRALVGAAGRK